MFGDVNRDKGPMGLDGRARYHRMSLLSRVSQPLYSRRNLIDLGSCFHLYYGRAFSDHAGIAQDLDAQIYFAHPYASWERGVNENTNGLIRQFFPKDQDLRGVTDQQFTTVMDTLNHRPRKTLDYRTPHEVFFDTTTSLTVALTN